MSTFLAGITTISPPSLVPSMEGSASGPTWAAWYLISYQLGSRKFCVFEGFPLGLRGQPVLAQPVLLDPAGSDSDPCSLHWSLLHLCVLWLVSLPHLLSPLPLLLLLLWGLRGR